MNPIFVEGETQPWAVFKDGYYYFIANKVNRFAIIKTRDITTVGDVPFVKRKRIYVSKNLKHPWGQRLFFIDGKWYIYCSLDDGNTDNRQIHVLENSSSDPTKGDFILMGKIVTDKNCNWAITPDVFKFKDHWYMIWSGWVSRREFLESQCIYIARMKDPLTLETERVMISKPEYEWERQWVCPDGYRREYPTYVNESPFFFHKPGSSRVYIFYSASVFWSSYNCMGALSADANADILNPSSWKKSERPIFKQSKENRIIGPGNPCIIPSPDGKEYFLLYSASKKLGARIMIPRLQKINFSEDDVPQFGIPLPDSVSMHKPSGT